MGYLVPLENQMTTTAPRNLTMTRNGELLVRRPVLAHWKEGWVACPYCGQPQRNVGNRCFACEGEYLEVNND